MSSKCGVFHQSYKSEMAIFQTWFARGWMALLFAWMLVFPFVAKPIGKALGTNVLYLANLIGIYIIGAQGLNLLTGYTGQISLGHGAFMGVGAYASAILTMKLGVPFWVALPLSGLVAAAGRDVLRHPLAAAQGPLPGDRDDGRAVHHPVRDAQLDLAHRRQRRHERARRRSSSACR